jgi:hypothetical protein
MLPRNRPSFQLFKVAVENVVSVTGRRNAVSIRPIVGHRVGLSHNTFCRRRLNVRPQVTPTSAMLLYPQAPSGVVWPPV